MCNGFCNLIVVHEANKVQNKKKYRASRGPFYLPKEVNFSRKIEGASLRVLTGGLNGYL